MGGVHWLGIAASELRSALTLRRVPRCDWLEVSDDVHFMGEAVAAEQNKRAAARSRSR